jgi:hypothetical protein
MNWICSTLTDGEGRFDVAYVSLFGVMGAVIGSIAVMCAMSIVAYMRCTPIVRETAALVTCTYDPQPLGIAIAAVCGGFATALGALAGYMLATRSRPGVTTTTVASHSEATTEVAPPTPKGKK